MQEPVASTPVSHQWVVIEFECLPLRSVARLDVPVDASPKYQAFVLRVKEAITKHGTHNAYYLHQGICSYHMTNDPAQGLVRFAFEGTVLTDDDDLRTRTVDVRTELLGETCPWLTEPIVGFLAESVKHALIVEFDRYIHAGDLERTRQRIQETRRRSDAQDGYVGMYL